MCFTSNKLRYIPEIETNNKELVFITNEGKLEKNKTKLEKKKTNRKTKNQTNNEN